MCMIWVARRCNTLFAAEDVSCDTTLLLGWSSPPSTTEPLPRRIDITVGSPEANRTVRRDMVTVRWDSNRPALLQSDAAPRPFTCVQHFGHCCHVSNRMRLSTIVDQGRKPPIGCPCEIAEESSRHGVTRGWRSCERHVREQRRKPPKERKEMCRILVPP